MDGWMEQPYHWERWLHCSLVYRTGMLSLSLLLWIVGDRDRFPIRQQNCNIYIYRYCVNQLCRIVSQMLLYCVVLCCVVLPCVVPTMSMQEKVGQVRRC